MESIQLGPKKRICIDDHLSFRSAGMQVRDILYGKQSRGEDTDFKIVVCGGEEIPVHRKAMSVSPYFKTLFESSMTEQLQGKVHLDDFSSDDIQSLIKFCYGQPLSISPDEVCDWYEMLNYFMLLDHRNFKAMFIPYLKRQIAHLDCIRCSKFAVRYDLVEIRHELGKHVRKHLTEFTSNTVFQRLDCEEVTELLVNITDMWCEESCDMAVQALICWLKTQGTSATSASKLTMVRWLKAKKTTGMSMSTLLGYAKIPLHEGCSLSFLSDMSAAYKHEPFWDDRWTEQIDSLIFTKTKNKNSVFLIHDPVGSKNAEEIVPPICSTLDLTTGVRGMIPSPSSGKLLSACKTPTGFAVLANSDDNQGCAVFVFNQHKKSWNSPVSAPSSVDSGTTIVSTQSQLYMLGNLNRSEDSVFTAPINSQDEDPWTSAPPMRWGMRKPITAVIKNDIYVAWNTFENPFGSSSVPLQVFKGASWRKADNLPARISTEGASMVAVSTTLYLIGGKSSLAYRYNTIQSVWTKFTPTYHRHTFGAAAVARNSIVLCGGYEYSHSPDTVTDQIDCYTGNTDGWERCMWSLPTPLAKHVVLPMA